MRRLIPCLVALTLAPAAPAQIQFEPVEAYQTLGRFQTELVSANFTRDGYPDLLTCDFLDDSVSVFKSERDGTFRAVIPGVGSDGYRIATAGDFNEDGLDDLIVGSHNRLWYLRGTGTGAFVKERNLGRRLADRLGTADVDGDGRLDFVATTLQGLEVFFGDGTGQFPMSVADNTAPQGNASGLAIADLDGDVRPDFVVSLSNNFDFYVVHNLGNRTFSPPRAYPLDNVGDDVSVGDLDGNGAPEIVIPHASDRLLSVVFDDGAGWYRPVRTIFSIDGEPTSTAVVDVDIDGNLDVVYSNHTRSSVEIRRGDGTGVLGNPQRFSLGGLAVERIVVNDLDLEQRPDIAAIGGGSRRVSVLLNRSETNCREGTVNAGAGAVTDVLFLNNQAGSDPARRVQYPLLEAVELRMKRPPAVPMTDTAPYAVYVWPGEPPLASRHDLPFRIGCTVFPTPLTGGSPAPVAIWNNARRFNRLGFPTNASRPAPDVFFSVPCLKPPGVFTVQGLIFDPGSAADVPASVTNAIVGIPVLQ